jgi:class 3 adenylate cyclase
MLKEPGMKIRYKLLILLLGLGCISVLVSGYISYVYASRGLADAATRQLNGIRRSKAQQLESHFQNLKNHVITLSVDRMFVAGMRDFRDAFHKLERPDVPSGLKQEVADFYRDVYLKRLAQLMPLRSSIEDYMPVGFAPYELQDSYLIKNPYPREQRDKLNDAKDGTQYSKVHAEYHPAFRKLIRQYGYYDLFLIDNETGRVVYTVAKEPDFATSLILGPYRASGLAKAFQACRDNSDPDAVCLVDYEDYEPSLGAPAMFIASPIHDGNERVGLLALQLSIDEIDRVISGNRGWERDGLGRSGDTGLVGADYLMRSNSRGLIQEPEAHLARMKARGIPQHKIDRIKAYGTTVLQQEVRLPSVEAALAGKEGSGVQVGSSGGRSLVSYGPLNVPGLHWTIASRMDESEALAAVSDMRTRLRLWTLAVVLLTALVALLLTRSIVRPVQALADASEKVAAGDLSVRVPVTSKDELGTLTRTFNNMVESIRQKTAEVAEKNRENEALLLNILPGPIADRLKGGESSIADSFAEVTVLFADIVGFTVLSGQIPPAEVVEFLNNLFTRFDALAHRHGVEKIKTIGDAYMAVAGLPNPYPDHAKRMVDMAMEMLEETRAYSREHGKEITIRIGVNAGPVVAGVIGSSKFIYDLWGDTVNVASRMESHGVAGAIQVTRPVYDALKDDYEFEERGQIDVKGKGLIETWIVLRRIPVKV